MAIEHDSIADGERHEPKGIATATSGQVYKANGTGSGAWGNIAYSELSGVFDHHGQLTASNNSTVIAVPLAADTTLATNTDYVQVAGIWDAIPHGENFGITQQANSFTIAQDGIYIIQMWVNVTSSINITTVAFKFAKNGVINVGRRPKTFIRNIGEYHSGSSFGIANFSAGDIVTLWIASDKAANITIQDAVFGAFLIRPL